MDSYLIEEGRVEYGQMFIREQRNGGYGMAPQ